MTLATYSALPEITLMPTFRHRSLSERRRACGRRRVQVDAEDAGFDLAECRENFPILGAADLPGQGGACSPEQRPGTGKRNRPGPQPEEKLEEVNLSSLDILVSRDEQSSAFCLLHDWLCACRGIGQEPQPQEKLAQVDLSNLDILLSRYEQSSGFRLPDNWL
ncbi:uncharacterized protein LOC135977977 isoform X3 [Chrysemys picta bellii]|uniref:uncharacterized protein LOC135977977 isoform X3 n=1 Tax=Chrysemys picta bellii TaxID=8478 RepID=UPI0032B1CB87